LSTLATLWWLSFWTAVGLCLGSFLNAVIYRIPRRRSLRVPLWSACPNCRKRIAWYDNIPILSFVRLRGRCRHCGVPISTRYLVIETTAALVVLMLLDAFLIAHTRAGLSRSEFGLTDRLSYDWPILVAHVILFACLLAMSAIDLEHYWVDIRFTNLVTAAGLVLHAIWTPRESLQWPRPSDATAVMSLFAMLGLGVTWIVLACQPHVPVEELGEPVEEPVEAIPADAFGLSRLPPSLASPSRAAGWSGTFLLIALFAALFLVEAQDAPIRHSGRAIVPLLLLYVFIMAASSVEREADHAIMEAIHEERHTARRVVLSELLLLMPAVICGAVGLWLMTDTAASARLGSALHTSVHVPGLALLRHWMPLHGLATAAAGFILAGALGWVVRIVFTLVFGKEAFGVGDIHLMAAGGCVAGWPVVVLAFFLTCVVAMIGWILTLPFKRTRALPLGPWLSWSMLAVVIFYQPIVDWPPLARALHTLQWFASGAAGPDRAGMIP